MTTPATPEQARAEQERWQKLLGNADTPESWYYQPGWGLQKHNADGLGLIAGQSDFATHGDLLLLEAAPTLARAHIALLGAYAEALERERWIPVEERLPEEHEDVLAWTGTGIWVASWFGSRWYTSSSAKALYVTHWQPLPTPPAQAPASAGGE